MTYLKYEQNLKILFLELETQMTKSKSDNNLNMIFPYILIGRVNLFQGLIQLALYDIIYLLSLPFKCYSKISFDN